ncbi:hypothetical protein RMATCC62417_00066 [Rhizopus microsporus]|nr:hypothetical protein RMATCC62417_00066 [Rhizopus microsporus]
MTKTCQNTSQAVNTQRKRANRRQCISRAPKDQELKIKMESIGMQENDEDINNCPAKSRPHWPKQIIPWWKPSCVNERPPYSYATLIAHAILCSKFGRLTLSDIYVWISKNYPAYTIGKGGWQNSIRHNLSLNKKWFQKIERRPTQMNPGKGSYWTLVPGSEQIFIDNLTREGGHHSKKYHDIGLTMELGTSRKGACYYKSDMPTVTPALTRRDNCQETSADEGMPLYATFRMVSNTLEDESKAHQKRLLDSVSDSSDSDDDSAVDVSCVETRHLGKRCRTVRSSSLSTIVSNSTQHVDDCMVMGTPALSLFPSFGFESISDNSSLPDLPYLDQEIYGNHLYNEDNTSFPTVPQFAPWPVSDPFTTAALDIKIDANNQTQKYTFDSPDSTSYMHHLYPPFNTPSFQCQFVSMQQVLHS